MSLEVIDLEELVKDYTQSFLDSDQRKHADLTAPVINWDFMHVLYGPTKYTPSGSPKPSAHVLFTANFTNDTPKPQTYTLRTERRTKSTCDMSFQKTFTYGAGMELKLTPPNPIIEANVGFKGELSKQKGVTETFEQELSWSVDNQIEVPSGYQTKAELVIKEDDYRGDFVIESTFDGKIVVTYENKKTREHITTINGHVKKVFKGKPGFRVDNLDRPVFTVKGVCKCRYGIEQNVMLTETKIQHGVREIQNGDIIS